MARVRVGRHMEGAGVGVGSALSWLWHSGSKCICRNYLLGLRSTLRGRVRLGVRIGDRVVLKAGVKDECGPPRVRVRIRIRVMVRVMVRVMNRLGIGFTVTVSDHISVSIGFRIGPGWGKDASSMPSAPTWYSTGTASTIGMSLRWARGAPAHWPYWLWYMGSCGPRENYIGLYSP